MHGKRACQQVGTDFRNLLAERLRAERERLGRSQAEMAALGGTKHRTYQDWERGLSAVSSEFLMAAAVHGLDMVFVLTGNRGGALGALSVEESSVLYNYRASTDGGRAAARAVLDAVGQQPARPAKRAVGE